MTKGQERRQRVLVTGASGFIGGHLAAALQARGYAVTAQYRREKIPAGLSRLAAEGVKLIRADLSLKDESDRLLDGAHAVIHAAALASDWGGVELFRQVNRDATVRLADAARRKGVPRFVYVSSVTVHGFGDHVGTTEEGPYYPLRHPYPETKREAEEYVLSLNAPSFRTTVVRPGNVYGPGDTTTFYKMFAYIEKGMMGYIDGGNYLTCPVFVGDLARGIILALESDQAAGKIYNLTDDARVTWKELLDFIYQEMGIKKKPVNSPAWLSLCLAGLLTFIYKLFRIQRPPPLTLYRIRQGSHHYSFSIEKARRELGYAPGMPWQEGLRETIQAYRSDRPSKKTIKS